MSVSDYPTSPTRAKTFMLNRQGQKVSPTEAIMGRIAPKKAEDLIEDERTPLQKKLDFMYEMQKELSNISPDSVEDYEVRPGDTISDVLERTGKSMGEFMALNDDASLMSSEGELYAGDVIQVVEKEDEDLI